MSAGQFRFSDVEGVKGVIEVIRGNTPEPFQELALAEAQRAHDCNMEIAAQRGMSKGYCQESSVNAALITARGMGAVRWHLLNSPERIEQATHIWRDHGAVEFHEWLFDLHNRQSVLLVAGVTREVTDAKSLVSQLDAIHSRHSLSIVAIGNLSKPQFEVVAEWAKYNRLAMANAAFATKPFSPDQEPQERDSTRQTNLKGVEVKLRHAVSFMNPSAVLLASQNDPVSDLARLRILPFLKNPVPVYLMSGEQPKMHANAQPAPQTAEAKKLFGARGSVAIELHTESP